MTVRNKAAQCVIIRVQGWAYALCALFFLGRLSFADPVLAPPPATERIQALIRDLGREYALPPTTWGGAIRQGSLQALQVFLERSERAASRAAQQELLKIGKAAVPQLIAALKTADGRKAEAIAQILGATGHREVLYPLLRLADDPDQVLRARFAAALGVVRQGDQSQWALLLAGTWLAGEWLLLADTLLKDEPMIGELDQARLNWFREAQQETFTAGLQAIRSLAPNARASSIPVQEVWANIVAWDKCWANAHPFLAVEAVADNPWNNRFWCERTLGTLSEYDLLIGEMRRLFIEERLRREASGRLHTPFGKLMEELQSMSYGAEPFPAGSEEAERFSLSGYVRSGMLIQDYGYDRKTGAWTPLDRLYFGVNGDRIE